MRFHHFSLACALTLVGMGAAAPQVLAQQVKPQERLSPQTLPRFLEEVRRAYRLPAMGAGIVFGDSIATSVVGVREMGGAAVEKGDAWHLSLSSQSMTATLIGMLVDDGLLSWDSTLEKMLPEDAATMNPKMREVTLLQLLTHRAGFGLEPAMPYGTTHDEWRAKTAPLPEQRREFALAVLKEAPQNNPNSSSAFAVRDYVIVGAIAERVSGKSWEDLIRARLFEPLGMKSAGFGPMVSLENMDAISSHRVVDGQTRVVPPGPGADNPLVIGPAGTIHCSVEDWGKYARFWLRGLRGEAAVGEAGDKTLLRPETFLLLATSPDGGKYAAGWQSLKRSWGGDVLSESGSNGSNYAVLWLAPAKNFAVLVTSNHGASQKACDDVASALVSELAKN